MLLAERAGRKLERRSNPAPRGMTVTLAARSVHKIRPIGLLHISFAKSPSSPYFSAKCLKGYCTNPCAKLKFHFQ